MVSFLRPDSLSGHLEILAPGDCRRTGDRRQLLTINGTLPGQSPIYGLKLIGDCPLLIELLTVNPDTGETVNTVDVNHPPVFDGLIAAQGHLYMCTTDGSIIRF